MALDAQTDLAELRRRLAEAEDTLRAIREGEVDALVLSGSNELGGAAVKAGRAVAKLERLSFTSVSEALAERFHMDEPEEAVPIAAAN